MATYVWFVPGFMGSTLSLYRTVGGARTSDPPLARLWGSVQSVLNVRRLDVLTLPGNLDPNTGIFADGLAASALGGYTDFATDMASRLPAGWAWVSWPYDWRLSARDVGRQLATALETAQSQGNTNYVVGHSLGALVAWAAWAWLVADTRTNAMSRMLTFGGALYGANSTPELFRENEDAMGQLSVLQSLLSGGPVGLLVYGTLGNPDNAVANLIGVAETWPSLYDLFPDPTGSDDPTDVNRAIIWQPATWSAALVPPLAALLSSEQSYFHTWLRTALNLPPPAVASHIVGAGLRTNGQVQLAPSVTNPTNLLLAQTSSTLTPKQRRLIQLPYWTSQNAGDGRASVAQQRFPGYYSQWVGSLHGSMQNDPYVRNLIVPTLQQPNPTQPVTPPFKNGPLWVPPPAAPIPPAQLPPQPQLPLVTAIVVPSGPQDNTPPAPVIRPRVGADP